MKKLLLVLSLVCSFAHSETIATLQNGAGGIIVLTDVKCDKNSRVVYSNDSGGNTWMGCWFFDDNFVFIKWSDGAIKTYPFNVWTFKNKKYD
jgi:hypothetical protein